MDVYIQKDEKRSPKRDEVIVWLVLFAKRAGDKMPDEDITVLPYRRKTALFEEYQDVIDCNSSGIHMLAKPAEKAYFFRFFDRENNHLKIRLQRDKGSFVSCTVYDAYATALRKAKTWAMRLQIKEWRRRHLAKQRAQRDKYYKHRNKASTPEGRKVSVHHH